MRNRLEQGPSPNQGPADDTWHIREGFANGNQVFASGEMGGEDAPVIKTELTIPEAGTYNVWVNFWANPDYDWRIKAGLSEENLRLFRQMTCRHVQEGDHNTSLIIADAGNTFLYQAFLGRIRASSNYSLTVFIDDETIQNGTSNTMIGDIARTWYDGIGFAKVDNVTTSIRTEKSVPPEKIELSQNFPNPFNPTTEIKFSFGKPANVEINVYDSQGRFIKTLLDEYKTGGTHTVVFDGTNLVSGIYYYRIQTENFIVTKKMLLIK